MITTDSPRSNCGKRTELNFPPGRRLVYVGVIGRDQARVISAAARYAEILRESGLAEVLGPAPYPIARVNDEWRYRIALKTATPQTVESVLFGSEFSPPLAVMLRLARHQRRPLKEAPD